MPAPYRLPSAGSFLGDGGGGSSVADLIMRSGAARADAELRGAAGWGDAIGSIAQSISGGLQQYQKQKEDDQVQNGIAAAMAPAKTVARPGFDVSGNPAAETATAPPDRNAILASIQDPALRERTRQGILAADTQAINFRKANQEAEASAVKARQQKDDYLASLAVSVKPFLGDPQSAATAVSTALSHAQEAGISPDEIAQIQAHIQQNPQSVGQIVDSLIARSPSVSKSVFEQQPKTREVTVTNADGSTTSKIVEDKAGQEFASAPKPVDLQHVETSKGIQPFNPRQGTLGPVIGQPKPPAALVTLNNAPKLSDAALDQQAETFYSTGKMPANLGRGNAGIARMTDIMNRTAQIHPDFNAAGAQSAFEANKKSLDKLQQQTDAVAAFETTASKNSDILEGVLKKLPDTGTSILNAPLRSLEGKLGSEDIAAFNTIRQSVQNEYSRIISSPTLSGTMSDSARKEGEAILHGDMTVGQLRTAIKILKAETANRHTSYQGQLDEITGRIRGKSAGAHADPLGILQ